MRIRSAMRQSRFLRLILGTGVVCLLAAQSACTGCQPTAPPYPGVGTITQANSDGYNYQKDPDRTTDFIYNHLWYFNFLDETQDIAGVAAYGLANPENLMFQKGVANSFGMIIRERTATEKSFPVYSEQWDPAVPGNFSASATFEYGDPILDPNPGLACGDPPSEGCHLQNPGGFITVTDAANSVYHMKGEAIAPDGQREMHWDLQYARGPGPGWRPWVKWPVPHTAGIFPAWISYHMNMPNAVVNGTFQVIDRTVDPVSDITYTLTDAKGYHDGFFSKFVFSIFEWDWLDFKQYEEEGVSEELSVHLLHPHKPEFSCQEGWETCTPGNLRVYHGGREYNFYRGKKESEKQIFISYPPDGEWFLDPDAHGVKCPPWANIQARDPDGTLRLDLTWNLKQHMVVYFDVPQPFNDTVTYEIIADFEGTFYEDDGRPVSILGPGWADYSGAAFPES